MEALVRGDVAWVLISTALVALMVPGLAFFYGGLVHNKSTLNTMLMCLGALAVITVQWVLVGYSLAFGPGNGWIGSLAWAGFQGVSGTPNPTYAGALPHVLFAAFQGMFAGITVALVAGAVIDRMRFLAYLLFGVLWSTLIYDPLAHWVWGDGGWLRTLGALDFAGGTVVHISAGITALVLALTLGPRRDFKRLPTVPHNVPFTLLGAGLLWFGWFGFNAGSALAADGIAANALFTTHASAAAALVAWMLLEARRSGRATAVGAATGAVVGLVAITPAAGFVTPLSALAIGALAAPCSFAGAPLPGHHPRRRHPRCLRLPWRRRDRRGGPHRRVREQGGEPGWHRRPAARQRLAGGDPDRGRACDDRLCRTGERGHPGRTPRGGAAPCGARRGGAGARHRRAWGGGVPRERPERSGRPQQAPGRCGPAPGERIRAPALAVPAPPRRG
ncbi:MAG: ammonium transporter [Gemmatimonadales bacterium]